MSQERRGIESEGGLSQAASRYGNGKRLCARWKKSSAEVPRPGWQLLRGGGRASSLGRAWKGRDSAGRELGNSSSADHGAAAPRLPLSVFRCEVGSAPGPGPSRRASARLRDRGAGGLHGDQGQEQLPQLTFRVTFSQMTFPALHLKEVGPDIPIVPRSFLCNAYLSLCFLFLCASLCPIGLPQWAGGSMRSETRAWQEPGTQVLNLC